MAAGDERVGGGFIEIGVEDDTAAGLKSIQTKLQAQMKVAAVKAGQVLVKELADAADDAGDRMLREIEIDAKRIEHVLDKLEKDRKVKIEAEAEIRAAQARLAALARDRIVNLVVKVNATKAAAEITALTKALAGTTLLGSFRDNVVALGTSLPQLTLKIGALSTAFASLGAPILNAASAIAPLASSLFSIWPLLLAGPGVALAFGAGLGVLVASFVKLDEATTKSGQAAHELFDFLGDAFDGLQKAIQANFWDGFIGPFQNLVKVLLPQLQVGMTRVAKAIGVQWGAVADAVARAFSNDRMTTFFDQLVAGTDAATPGFAALWEALSNIALIGGQFLPKIGEWVSQIGQRFLLWTQTADIAGMISNAALQFGFLLDVLREVGGIIGGIFTAMDTGKSTGLESLAATLGKISDVVNGPGFQTALGTIFDGAAAGASALSAALTPIGAAFEKIAPVIGHFFDVLGNTGADVLERIFTALSQPVVVDGLLGAIDALAKMISGINWEMLTPILASITEAIAKIAPNLTDLVNAILPFLPTIISLFGQVAAVIGQILPVIINLLEPLLNNEGALLAVAAGIGAVVGAFKLISGVTGIVKTIIGLMEVWPAIIQGITVAWRILSAAFTASPIGLIITAVVALVAALIWFFTQTELGKEIVANVIKFIGEAFTWLWENAIKPTVDAIVVAWQWLMDAFVWLWENGIKPVIDFIVDAWTNVLWPPIKLIIDLIVNYFRFWAAVAKWLWENAIQPALKAIGDFFSWLWDIVIKAVIDAIAAALEWLGGIFTWLWENAIKPALDAVAQAFQWLYDTFIQPYVDLITAAIHILGDVFTWLYENVIKPVWEGIKSAIDSAWKWIDQNVFTPFKTGIDLLVQGFEIASSAIAEIWEGIKKAVAEPINFVLDTIWNNGLRSFWNDLVTELGLKDMKLKKAPLVSFARGGVFKNGGQSMLPGYTPGRDVHTFFSPTGGLLKMSGGEGIIRPDALRALGGKRWLDQVNKGHGRRSRIGDGQGNKSKGFLGDAFAWVADAVAVVGDFLLNPVAAIDKYLVQGIIMKNLGGLNIFGQTVAGIAGNTVKGLSHAFDILAPSDGKDKPANAMGWQTMWALIQRAIPGAVMTSNYRSPASNAAAGGVKGSYHTQGRALDLVPANMAMFNKVKALFPNARELIYTPAGAGQLLNGKSFSGWSDYVKKIHFSHIHVAMKNGGIFDNGGFMPPGGYGVNLTNKPEAVFTAEQFRLLARNVAQMDTILAAQGGYRPTALLGDDGRGTAGSGASSTQNITVAEGAVKVVGPDPYRAALEVGDRLAERIGVLSA